MDRDDQRIEAIRRAMREEGLTALLCTLPSNVLLTTGYWPVVGTSVVVAGLHRTIAIVPEDERALAERGWADEVRAFEPGSLERIFGVMDAAAPLVREAARDLGLSGERVGYEARGAFEPASYVAMHVYGAGTLELLREASPDAQPSGADALLARLKAVKTPREVEGIRAACRIAERAFVAGVQHIRAGVTEVEGAARFGVPLAAPSHPRSGGHVAFMSGPNAARAHGSHASSGDRRLQEGDLVLVHCNSYAGGLWTDITRTFCLGPPDERRRRMYEAVLAARAAALASIRPGARAADVDRAAREVLASHGFGGAFKHPTGHGVGHAAIDHDALPRIHPRSDGTLDAGMVFNVEPAVYLEGLDGMRHCDVVAVTEGGVDLLTPFQADAAALTIAGGAGP